MHDFTTLKNDVEQYWTKRADSFSELHWDELHSGKRALWVDEILRYVPEERPLRILDIGTGSGFFALVMASYGHKVTGIDLSDAMIDHARAAAFQLHRDVRFEVMDAERLQFEPASFDVIVSRNLTCMLPDLEAAYLSWKRVLVPGGLLVNFDADYGREKPFDQQDLPADHAHKDIPTALNREYERIRQRLARTQEPRPLWDKRLLEHAGFHDIALDETVSERVYPQPDRFYNPTPMFAIKAVA